VNDHKGIYIKNAAYLAILTVVEVGIAYLNISQMSQIVLLLTFAVAKMMLVVMVYMHLRYETKTLKWILFIPIPAGIYFAVGVIYDLPFRWVM